MKNPTALPLDWREGRRLRAWELHQQGWLQAEIAEALGVTPGAVSQWLKRAREQGESALRRHPPPGRPPRLTLTQRAQLPAWLAQGPAAFGFRGEVWTTPRVAAVIAHEFGVRYHPAHVSRLLRAIGWSVQRPIQQASQRDEGAIERWKQRRWPQLKKAAIGKGARSSG